MTFNSKLLALIVAIIMGLSYFTYTNLFDEKPSIDELKTADRLSLKKNIVVMGVDEREGDTGRSDTLFVVMFDPKSKNASLLSIPRDTMVKISQHGWDKINHAYAYGGAKMTRQTVEEFLGIRVNNYVQIDVKGLARIVDAIGGVDINVEKDMHYSDPYDSNGGLIISIEKGPQHLDGAKAIQYVRYRDEEGDIGRIKRQQKFITAVYDKVVSAQILVKIPGLLKEITSMIKTDLDLTDMGVIAKVLYEQSKGGGLNMATVPGEPAYIEDISYWIPDMTDLREQMVTMQGGVMSPKYRAAAERYESEYRRLVPETGEENNNKDKKIIIEKSENPELMKALEVAKKIEKNDKKQILENKAQKSVEKEEKTTESPKKNTQSHKVNEGERIRVNILNCSGRPEESAKVEAMARKIGLEISSISTGEVIATTQVVATTGKGKVVEKLGSLPFRYALRVVSDKDVGIEGTIYIGQDFK